MPLLDDAALRELRELQKDIRHCRYCTAQVWRNYCRECDEIFEDGHYENCRALEPEVNKHASHRKY